MARTDRQPRSRMNPEQRRAMILDAASQAFAERPFSEVTIASIAAGAGASEALVYQYFPGKAELYTEAVRQVIGDVRDRHDAAQAALPENTSARDRVQTWLMVWLDEIEKRPSGWATAVSGRAMEPVAASELRAAARQDEVERLRGFLLPGRGARATYALQGFIGFFDAACHWWLQHGCPDNERWPMIEAALGALEGALGDWGR